MQKAISEKARGFFSDTRRRGNEAAPNVERIALGPVNAYMVGTTKNEWVLVDTGVPGAAGAIRRAAERRYGAGTRPKAIILTHGHHDHAGSALNLANAWDVPVYAHPLERPFLTGESAYPPADPTVGGPTAFLTRFQRGEPLELGERLQDLPEDGSVPGLMPDWHWVHTPGHTPGHVSLFRETDRALIAGDAVVTANVDSWIGLAAGQTEVRRPPAPSTPDWAAARQSVEELADLEPSVVAVGHGRPVAGTQASAQLRSLASDFHTPAQGRYVGRAPQVDPEKGVVQLPPPVDDPMPRVAAGIAAGAAGVAALLALLRRRT